MKKLVAELSKSGSLVVDPFSVTLATAKACFLLNNHIRFIGCDIDLDCLDVALPGFLLVFGIQILDGYSDITVDYNVQDAARVFICSSDGKFGRKVDHLNVWYPVCGLKCNGSVYTSFRSHATSIVPSHCPIWGNMPLQNCSCLCQRLLEMSNFQALVAAEL